MILQRNPSFERHAGQLRVGDDLVIVQHDGQAVAFHRDAYSVCPYCVNEVSALHLPSSLSLDFTLRDTQFRHITQIRPAKRNVQPML